MNENKSKQTFAEYEVTRNHFYCPKCDANLLEKFVYSNFALKCDTEQNFSRTYVKTVTHTAKTAHIVRRYLLIRNVGKRKPNVFLDIYLTLDLNCHNGLIIITHTHTNTHTDFHYNLLPHCLCFRTFFGKWIYRTATAANYSEEKNFIRIDAFSSTTIHYTVTSRR